jgi:hypothetical protein
MRESISGRAGMGELLSLAGDVDSWKSEARVPPGYSFRYHSSAIDTNNNRVTGRFSATL